MKGRYGRDTKRTERPLVDLGTGIFLDDEVSLVSPILSIYAKSFDVPYTLATLSISIYAIGRLFSDLPFVMLGDRFGRNPERAKKTLLMYRANFSHSTLHKFLNVLLDKKLCTEEQRNGTTVYLITARGRRFLHEFQTIRSFFDEHREACLE